MGTVVCSVNLEPQSSNLPVESLLLLRQQPRAMHPHRKARRTGSGSHSAGVWVTDNVDINANLWQSSAPFSFGETTPHVVGEGDLLYPYFAPQAKDVHSDGYHGPFPVPVWAPPSGDPKPPPALGQALPLASQLGPLLVTTSPAGSTVSGSSGELSPVQTDLTSCLSLSDIAAAGNAWARVPSPLRFPVTTEEQRAPGLAAVVPQDKRVADPGQVAFPHVCRWNENGPCRSSGFSTREELNSHVKTEHLLECSVVGCVEGAFRTKDLLACHVRHVHDRPLKRPASCLLDGTPCDPVKESPRLRSREGNNGPEPARTSTDDRKLKYAMSIATSKRKCREQLRSVMEKKLKKANAGMSPLARSTTVRFDSSST